jgi:hypothetical protein
MSLDALTFISPCPSAVVVNATRSGIRRDLLFFDVFVATRRGGIRDRLVLRVVLQCDREGRKISGIEDVNGIFSSVSRANDHQVLRFHPAV